jgi:hypothetical protein
MRYHWGLGIGHTYSSQTAAATPTRTAAQLRSSHILDECSDETTDVNYDTDDADIGDLCL